MPLNSLSDGSAKNLSVPEIISYKKKVSDPAYMESAVKKAADKMLSSIEAETRKVVCGIQQCNSVIERMTGKPIEKVLEVYNKVSCNAEGELYMKLLNQHMCKNGIIVKDTAMFVFWLNAREGFLARVGDGE